MNRRFQLAFVLAAAAGVMVVWTPAAMAQVAQPELPTLPDVVPVAVDPSTTAFLVLDITSTICPPRPACLASTPAIARLLAKARAAGVFVVYSNTGSATFQPDVAPRPNDPIVSGRADKFFGTNLDQLLSDNGIQTAIIVGSAANGAVLYTTFGAVERGYAAVVAVDGISSGPDFDTFLTEYQLLSMPGFSNPTNDPLKAQAATLSRSDLISFGSASK
jgi:nicotinamidase-related amidase